MNGYPCAYVCTYVYAPAYTHTCTHAHLGVRDDGLEHGGSADFELQIADVVFI